MGAIIPVISGGGGYGGIAAYPRQRVDNSGAEFLAAMMSSDQHQSRSDPNTTLALVLQLAMQKESLAESRRQFNELLTERSGQFEENMKYLNRTLTEQMKMQGEQLGFLRQQYADQRSDIEDLRQRLLAAEERGRAAATAQNLVEALKARTIASADIAQKEKAVESAATQAAFAEEVKRGVESVGEKLTNRYEPPKSPTSGPRSYEAIMDFAKGLETRALNITDPAERARFANEASAQIGDLLTKVQETEFDITSPMKDITVYGNPLGWIGGLVRMATGRSFTTEREAEKLYKQSAIDRLRSTRFLLNKMADPAINERESLKAAKELQRSLGKVESAQTGIQRSISRLGAQQPGATPFAELEGEIPEIIGRYLEDPNASTTTSASEELAKFHEYATTRPW